MRSRGEKMLDEIAFFLFGGAFARRHPDHAFATAALRPKSTHRSPLNKAAVGNANDATLIGNEVLHVDVAFVDRELSQARRTMFVP